MQKLADVVRCENRWRSTAEPLHLGTTMIGCPDARLVLKALKLIDQRPPSPPEGEETVM
jgi:hypothetical protein